MDNIIITTTDTIEGHHIQEYKGLVSARCPISTILLNAGDSSDKDKNLKKYLDAINQLEENARTLTAQAGANALISARMEFLERSMVTAIYLTGTAVVID